MSNSRQCNSKGETLHVHDYWKAATTVIGAHQPPIFWQGCVKLSVQVEPSSILRRCNAHRHFQFAGGLSKTLGQELGQAGANEEGDLGGQVSCLSLNPCSIKVLSAFPMLRSVQVC